MPLKRLYTDAAVGAGASSDRARVQGRERVTVLMNCTGLGGGFFYPFLVFDTPDGEVEAEPHFPDPGTANTWYKFGMGVNSLAYVNIPCAGASWIYFKLVGGTGATGVNLWCTGLGETS